MAHDSLTRGFGIIHSNQLEVLADALIDWTRGHPLLPLEKETILVQANGMADWLKVRMVEQVGVAASYEFPLPATFLWRLYRQVLGQAAQLDEDPFAKANLEWRIYRLLPQLIEQNPQAFKRPAQFLQKGETLDETRRYQLAHRLADLFDQYQLYRSDWLIQWRQGQNITPANQNVIWRQDETWQKLLWQALVADIQATHGEAAAAPSRAELHQRFIKRLQQAANNGETLDGLPKRLFLFGINSLPEQLLNAVYHLSAHCQVFLFILNPSAAFWQERGDGFVPSETPLEDAPLTNPLLDSWGGRGRDFLRLLAEQEERQPEDFRHNLNEIRAFVTANEAESVQAQPTLPLQIQQDILDNSQPTTPRPLPEFAQAGLAFLPAYSRQREVEVLHDRLLALFNQRQADGQYPSYRDVIVMVPNIDDYAAHIHAVFRREPRLDAAGQPNPRRLDYRISDTNPLTNDPLYAALDYLLHLPDARFSQSELLGLLELDAVRRAFGIQAQDLEQITTWMNQGAIRWGFDGQQKAQILHPNIGQNEDQTDSQTWRNNTWQQGLDRLLAGYCAGDANIWEQPTAADTAAVMNGLAIDEVSGNQGDLLGRVYQLLESLNQFRQRLQGQRPPQGDNGQSHTWEAIFGELFTRFFAPQEDQDQNVLDRLKTALGRWLEACRHAHFNDALPLATARSGWLGQIEQAGMSGKLNFSGVTFCTLMPMRALPFKHIFLLGMNDGDYPRQHTVPDFDLMDADYRSGDRDRRGDDQYLFLEALLSVRQTLTISWVGKSIHNRAEKQPSTLISQLQDYVNTHWQTTQTHAKGQPLAAALTLTQHYPLTPFSRQYFADSGDAPQDKPVRTYAHEWRRLYEVEPQETPAEQATLPAKLPTTLPATLDLWRLVQLLKNPAKVFYQQRLGVYFHEAEITSEDDEPFKLDSLQQWKIRQDLLTAAIDGDVAATQNQLLHDGSLPAGSFAQSNINSAQSEADNIKKRAFGSLGKNGRWQEPKSVEITVEHDGQPVQLVGQINQIWQTDKTTTQVLTTASKLDDKGWRYDKLAAAWVQHLAACAVGNNVETRAVGLQGFARFSALSKQEAINHLAELVAAYAQAIQQPIAFAPKAATAYIKEFVKDAEIDACRDKSKIAFESSYNYHGDDQDAYIKRAFPQFDVLWSTAANDGGAFIHWIERLYMPIHAAISHEETQS